MVKFRTTNEGDGYDEYDQETGNAYKWYAEEKIFID